MAALTATRQYPWANLGNVQAGVFEVTCSGSAGHVVTGLKNVWFACAVSETETSTDVSSLVFNSNDGTAGTLAGSVYLFSGEDSSDVLQLFVIGW